jgi:hypothetical protein
MKYKNEEDDCEYFYDLNGCNVCYPNVPYSCARSKREGLCVKGTGLKLHMVRKEDGKYRYICNGACNTTGRKCATQPGAVTCKNCIRIMIKWTEEDAKQVINSIYGGLI